MKFITIDFETYYDQKYSLKKLTTEAYINTPQFEMIVADIIDIDGNHHMVDGLDKTDADIADEFNELGLGRHPVLAHNMAFDGAILAWKYRIIPPMYLDTQSMARPTLFPKLGSVSLGAIGEAFQGLIGTKGTELLETVGKRRAAFNDADFLSFYNYCKNDTAMCRALFLLLKPKFSATELLMIDRTIRMYTDPKLRTDRRELKFGLLEAEAVVNDALNSVASLGVSKAQLMSNNKFANALEEFGGHVPMKISPTTGQDTFAFSKADIEFVRMAHHENENIAKLVQARLDVKSTIQVTRSKRLMDIHDRMWGRLPVPLKYYGAMTGRFAGWDGINMQNPPKAGHIRMAMKPNPGFRLVAADQAQIEARMNACFSKQNDLVEQFRAGVDVYADMATAIYGFAVDKASFPDERFVGKTAILGCGYGVGPQRFWDMLLAAGVKCDFSFAERVVAAYRAKYPQIVRGWWNANDMLGHMVSGTKVKFGCCETRHNKLKLPNGMFLHYDGLTRTGVGRETEYWYRSPKGAGRHAQTKIYGAKLIENVMQALTRVLMTDQLVMLSMKYDVVMQMHDEIVLSIRTLEVPEAKQLIDHVMTQVPDWMPNLPLAVEINDGANYAECK